MSTSSPAARRLTARIAEQGIVEVPPLFVTTVATVVAGTSRDGTYSVTVAINADNVPAPYLASYINGHTPTVGDAVAVYLAGGSPLILGRVIGFPNF